MKREMRLLSHVLFWLGLICIPLSWGMWYLGPEIEIGRQVMGGITDPALRVVLKEAHAERWGLFVGLWPVTLLVLSYIVGKKGAEGQGR